MKKLSSLPVENAVVLLAAARNNVTLRTMAIVHPADMPDSRDQKKAGARKREMEPMEPGIK